MTEEPKRIPLPKILGAVARVFQVKDSEILGHRRGKDVLEPRYAAALLMVELRPDMSKAEISRFMRRDHSSINHALDEAAKRVALNSFFAEQVERARQMAPYWQAGEAPVPVEEVVATPVAVQPKKAPAGKFKPAFKGPVATEEHMPEGKICTVGWYRRQHEAFVEAMAREHPERDLNKQQQAAE